jgi:hypothetical protein
MKSFYTLREGNPMDQLFKLEFEKGGLFKAKFLTESAPKTCQFFLNSLPFSSSVLHGFFSGHIFYGIKGFEFYEVENPIVFGARAGDIFLNTNANQSVFEGKRIPPRLVISYSSSVVFWNWAGWLPSNYFAKIIEGDLDELFRVGQRIKWEGKEEFKCTLI